MFPWWVSWFYCWWTCTGCLLSLLVAFPHPVSPEKRFAWQEMSPWLASTEEGFQKLRMTRRYMNNLRKENSVFHEEGNVMHSDLASKLPTGNTTFGKIPKDSKRWWRKFHKEKSPIVKSTRKWPTIGKLIKVMGNNRSSKPGRWYKGRSSRNWPIDVRSSEVGNPEVFSTKEGNTMGRGTEVKVKDTSDTFFDKKRFGNIEKRIVHQHKSDQPFLLIHGKDIASLEVPSLSWSKERDPTAIKIPFKEKRTAPVSRRRTEMAASGREQKNKKKDHGGSSTRRILKTLVTTPKRIIGSLQGMGGSAVKPAGASVQHFATEPAPQTAVVGSTAVLPCRVMGKVGHLQWTKDGFGLGTDRDLFGFSRYSMIGDDDEGDYSLRIQPVLLEDDSLFQCQVSAIDGIPGIRSKPVRLTVYVPPDPPRVLPPVLETTTGETVTLECTSIGGRPAPEIQWVDDSHREGITQQSYVMSELMPDRKRYIVTSKLSFVPSRYHNNQTVTCYTSNQALSSPLTSSIFLSVLFPPELQLSSNPTTLIEGDDVTFLCEAYANPSLVTYRWFIEGVTIPNKTGSTMRLDNISRNLHRNQISCEVSNRVGTSKIDKNVTVRYGPTFRSMPRDVMSDEGQKATLRCNVDSNPAASIVWLKRGSNKIIGSGSSLTIQVNSTNAGLYKCVARVRGSDFEFPELVGHMKLLLKGPPTIVSDSEQEGRLGDTVSIVCSTVSVPSPIKVTWAYNGKEIDLNDPRYEVVEDEGREKLRNILVIHDSDMSDFGAYNCSVINEYGVAKKLITLQPEKRVPVVFIVGTAVAVVVIVVVVVSLVFCNKRHAQKERVPVVFIVGTAVAVVVIVVVVVSLVFCNKRHAQKGFLRRRTIRLPADISDSLCRHEKDLVRGNQMPNHANHDHQESHMYSHAPAEEVKLLQEDKPTTLATPNPAVQITPMHPNGHYSIDRRKSGYPQPFQGSHGSGLVHSLSGEFDHKLDCESVRYDEDHISYRSRSHSNINFPLEDLGRRSMTQTSLLTSSPQKYASSTSPDYSSLRRGTHPYGILRNHHHHPASIQNGHLGTLPKSPYLNGTPPHVTYSPPKRSSPYNSPSSGAWSPTPLPPPYPRSVVGNGRLPPDENRPVTRLSNSIGSEGKRMYTPGSKFITGATYL